MYNTLFYLIQHFINTTNGDNIFKYQFIFSRSENSVGELLRVEIFKETKNKSYSYMYCSREDVYDVLVNREVIHILNSVNGHNELPHFKMTGYYGTNEYILEHTDDSNFVINHYLWSFYGRAGKLGHINVKNDDLAMESIKDVYNIIEFIFGRKYFVDTYASSISTK